MNNARAAPLLFCRRMLAWRILVLLALCVGSQATPSPPAAVDASTSTEAAPDVAEPAAVASEAESPADTAEAAQEDVEPEFVSAPEEEVVDASAPEEPPEVRSGSASVQWVVTKKMQARLAELGYTDTEVEQLDPERAAAIIRRSITRPPSGVPAGWNRGVRRQQQPLRSAVQAGVSLLTAVRKPLSASPVPLVLTGLLGALGCLKVATGGSSDGPRVKQALAPDPAVAEIVPEGSGTSSSSDDLWLDVQIDRFIAWLKTLIAK